VGSDQPLCLGDIVSINAVVGLDVHGSTPRTRDYESVLALTGYGYILHSEPSRRPALWQS
jgi:hypothetical protein